MNIPSISDIEMMTWAESRRDRTVTEPMIQAACVAAYGVGADKDSNLHKLMKRAIQAALAV